MKIVITGALGHIGSYVLRELPEIFPQCDIILLDNLSTQRYSSLFDLPENARYQFHEMDVLEADLGPFIAKADVVIHLAAITNAAASFSNKDVVEHNNLNATIRIADACSESGVPLIHLSSTSVYGTQNETVDEACSDEELKPQSPYAETKLKEESYLRELSGKSDLSYVICRFGTICGVSKGMRFHTAVNKFCWQAVTKQPITVWRTALHQKRPYLTLVDTFKAICFIIQNKLFDGEIYNIVTANLTVNDILNYIKDTIPEIQIEYVDTEIMNQLSYEVSSQKIRDAGLTFGDEMKTCIGETISLLKGIRN